jgi:hypothetical protein
MCRKRKPRKNTTKGWFVKNVVDSSPPEGGMGTSSPPIVHKRGVRKMTPKKKMAE